MTDAETAEIKQRWREGLWALAAELLGCSRERAKGAMDWAINTGRIALYRPILEAR